jgi:cell division protein ZipA
MGDNPGMNWNPDIGIPLAVAGTLLLIAIAFFGRPRKPDQGRRLFGRKPEARREPVLGDTGADAGIDDAIQTELELLERTLSGKAFGEDASGSAAASAPQAPGVGARTTSAGFDRIVTLFVAARPGEKLRGSDLVVAAEKAGLVYGDMNIFHRLVDGKPEAGTVFSVANMVKPGSFDMRRVHEIETPGITFFMTLPGPMAALDAWETLLPTAQRMAELLDASVLDEERNTLGRQRIAHMRDELRSYDRKQEKQQRAW